MSTVQQKFQLGAFVQKANEPESVGVVREARWDDQVESWNYVIQFGAQLKGLPEESLRPLTAVQTPWEALHSKSISGRQHFISSLTYHRLKNPPARIARSFATARTQFYPHQFKPLLKFLDNPSKRILIADDVGLGKTIEAAYILRELDAHQAIERVLILVPSRLKKKWQQELRQRFGEYFDIVKGSDLAGYARQIAQGREPEPFKWIVSLESSRSEEIRVQIENSPIGIDVLIVDEAHRLRNKETQQHRVGAVLSRASDAIMFLSATPVQNKLEDLWTLLRLLSPDEFAEFPVFQRQITSNRYILAAQNAVAQRPPDTAEAQLSLESFFRYYSTSSTNKSTFADSIFARLRLPEEDRRFWIELQSDISRLSPTGHIISRTRKVDAIPNRPKRDARWTRIKLTGSERKIYDHIEDICRRYLPSTTSSWGMQMALLTAYRMTASCIPAALAYFEEKIGTGTDDQSFLDSSSSEQGDDTPDGEVDDADVWSGPLRSVLSEMLGGERPSSDSKFGDFLAALRMIWDDDKKVLHPPRKVVVFSFFRRTIEYLSRLLNREDVRNRYIHGGVNVDDRETAIDDFLRNPDTRVLLTSEVGGEGIDLQKASVLFNYDLPWNPMVVEQRIGRIDRIGQEADRLVIVNFVVQDSVEEHVLQRLLTKIEIFKESIGEPDPIIGEEIERLTASALSGRLDSSELYKRVEQEGDALAHRVIEAKHMLSRVDGLLAADQVLIDEINAIIGERQLPSERELIVFLNFFLAQKFIGVQIPSSAIADVVTVEWEKELGFELEEFAQEFGYEAALFGRKVSTGPVLITLSREIAYRHSRAELLHLRHPLTQYALKLAADSPGSLRSAFALRLHTRRLPPGQYLFLVALVNIGGSRPSTRIVPLFASEDGKTVWADSEETIPLLVEVLEGSADFVSYPAIGDFSAARASLIRALESLKRTWEARERKLEEARFEQQLLGRATIADFRIQRLRDRLTGFESAKMSDAVLRMARGQLGKAEREKEAGLAASKTSIAWTIEHEEIGVGILEIEDN